MRWYSAASYLIPTLSVAAAVFWPEPDPAYSYPLIWAGAAIVLISGAVRLFYRWDRWPVWAFLPISLSNVLAVLLVVWATGGSRSPFLPLFVLNLVFAAGQMPLWYSRSLAVAVAGALVSLAAAGNTPDGWRQTLVMAPVILVVTYFISGLLNELLQQRHQNSLLAALVEASKISTSLDLERTLEATAQTLRHAVQAHNVVIYLYDPEEDRLIPKTVLLNTHLAAAEEAEAIRSFRFRIGQGVAGWVALFGEPLLLGDAVNDPRYVKVPGMPETPQSFIVAPMLLEGRNLGVVWVSRYGLNQFDQQALQTTIIVANQAAVAIENARLYETTRWLTITDGLTGLFNARHLHERLQAEVNRAHRYGHPLALALIDADALKQVNDQFGHQYGDALLQGIARVIRGSVRETDLVFRYAGDEFIVLLPETDADAAFLVIDRVRAQLEAAEFPFGGEVLRSTCSCGVAAYPLDGRTPAELIQAADQAMYRAKNLGKNQTVLTGASAESTE